MKVVMDTKKIKPKSKEVVIPMTVGEKLRTVRTKKGLSIVEVETKTLIRAKYIEAFEQSKFYALPLPVYTYGFLQSYAQFLGLNGNKLLAQFKSEFGLASLASVKNFRPESKLKPPKIIITPKLLWTTFASLAAVGIIAYIVVQVMGFASAPVLIVDSPVQQAEVVGGTVQVSGLTDSGSAVTIGQERVLVDEQGRFNETVTVEEGVNSIAIKSTGRSGRTRTVVRTVTVKEPHTAYSAGEGTHE